MPKPFSYVFTEDQEAYAFAGLLLQYERMGKILKYSHIHQEGYLSVTARRKRLYLGTRAGIPDYVIVTPKKVLFIEMKRRKKSHTSVEQKEWIEALNVVSGTVIARVCFGFDEAKSFVDTHL
jgi:hypothetical protein